MMILQVRVTPEMLQDHDLSASDLEEALRNAVARLVHPKTGKPIAPSTSPVIDVSDGTHEMRIY